ncbi:MAG: hypothetical protein JXQ93_03025 [Flavobacteriaceae bacterium]
MKLLNKFSLLIFAGLIMHACTTNNQTTSGCATECSYTLASGETAGTAPTSLEGTHSLAFDYAQSGSPFTNGTTATFTLANNELTVEVSGMDCIVLKNPVQTSPSEYTFKDDCRDNLAYAVSSNQSGGLNEINVQSLSNNWFGQFK